MSDYVLHELLAEGGMGAVYAGEEIGPNGSSRPIACKVMSREIRGNTDLAALFRAEAETNRRLSDGHDGLVNFYNWFGDQEDREFMIMELVPGCDLLEICAMRERIPFDIIRLIARDILDVLAYVHGQGIVHRDISSANVLISRQGKVKLLDFGLAKSPSPVPADRNGKRMREFRGKLPYVSPEVVLCLGADERSDLYSFGALLYELLTGTPPFGDEVTLQMLREKIADWSIPDLPEGIPEDLRALTMGLLRCHAQEREPATAAQARDMLRLPADVEGTRAELASLVAATCQREPDAKAKTRDRGSFAGVHIKGVYITDGLADRSPVKPQTSVTRPRRSFWRYGAMSLVGIVALAALILGTYNFQRGNEGRAGEKEASATMNAPSEEVDMRSAQSIPTSRPNESVPTDAEAPNEPAREMDGVSQSIERPRSRSYRATQHGTNASTPAVNKKPDRIGRYRWR